MLPTASQVVTPLIRDFNSPSSIACENSSMVCVTAYTVHSTVCSALPLLLCLVRCIRSHGNRVINSWWPSNVVVWSTVSFLVMLGVSARHAYMISFSSLLISVSIKILFFLNCTQSFLSARSLRFPHRMASWILICSTSHRHRTLSLLQGPVSENSFFYFLQ